MRLSLLHRLPLLHKGLLLVSIPLCFELGIFSLLLSLQNDMAIESARINKARMIGDTVNKVTHKLLIVQEIFQVNQNPFAAAKEIRAGMAELKNDFAKLAELTVDSKPPVHENVLASEIELDKITKELDKVKTMLATGQIEDFNNISKLFRPKLNEHFRKIVSLGLFELAASSAEEIDTDQSNAIRNQTTFLLKLAVATSALIGLLGAWLYSRHLVSRLNIVMENAGRLGERKPLLEPISGNDEIAGLDDALHQAAQLIEHLDQAREEVIGMVSHDIRSPLTTIKCTGEALELRLDGALDERGKALLKTIEGNCDRILRISQDLLDMQKIESGMLSIQRQKTNVSDCLTAAIEATDGLRHNRGITIESNLIPLEANIDAGRIEQVVTNLLSNAIKHSPRNGIVRLSLQNDKDADYILIAVSDSGRGVPEHLKEAIFDRFQQVSEEDSSRGTGLGLAICKALIELHDGRIGVDSLSPTGSQFWILLPKN